MDKLLFDGQKVTISNDGATIMKLLDIVHPAARVLAEISMRPDRVKHSQPKHSELWVTSLKRKERGVLKLRDVSRARVGRAGKRLFFLRP